MCRKTQPSRAGEVHGRAESVHPEVDFHFFWGVEVCQNNGVRGPLDRGRQNIVRFVPGGVRVIWYCDDQDLCEGALVLVLVDVLDSVRNTVGPAAC